MKKIIIVLLFLWGGCVFAQIDPGADPNWGWQPKRPCLPHDTIVIDWGKVVRQEIGFDTILFYIPERDYKGRYDFYIMLPQYENEYHNFTADMFRAIYNETEQLNARIYELEKIINRMEQKRLRDSTYRTNNKSTIYLEE